MCHPFPPLPYYRKGASLVLPGHFWLAISLSVLDGVCPVDTTFGLNQRSLTISQFHKYETVERWVSHQKKNIKVHV